MKRNRLRAGAAGFTLIEVLIALVILTIGMTGMIPVLIQTIRGNAFGGDTTQAAAYAQDKMEELRRMEWGDLTTLVGAAPATDADATTDLTRGWQVIDTCTGCSGSVYAIEVCAARTTGDNNFTDACFSVSPLASFHFLSFRSNL